MFVRRMAATLVLTAAAGMLAPAGAYAAPAGDDATGGISHSTVTTESVCSTWMRWVCGK